MHDQYDDERISPYKWYAVQAILIAALVAMFANGCTVNTCPESIEGTGRCLVVMYIVRILCGFVYIGFTPLCAWVVLYVEDCVRGKQHES